MFTTSGTYGITCVKDHHGYVPLVAAVISYFLFHFFISGCLTRVTWQMLNL